MNFTTAYVFLIVSTVLVCFWVFLFLRYRNKYDEEISAIDPKQYFLPELFFIGFGVLDMFRINMKTERGRRKEKKIAEVYGDRYAEFYHRCIVAGQVTYSLTLIPLGLLFGAIVNDPMYAFLALLVVVALVVYLDWDVNNSIEKKRDEILSDYPEVLSKLALLVNAGMIISDAWKKVAYTSDKPLYKEMQTTTLEMNNGIGIIDALYRFSQRCGIKEIRKFASIVSQSIMKSENDLPVTLRYMSQESWEEKKHAAKRKGETASSKLMMPLMIMFIGILIMVIVPIFSNIMV